MNPIRGMHHVTAITSSAEKNYEFFTYILGMRLVKKTVNQDDIQTYHLFFADDEGNAGTDMTFFDFPGIPKGSHGTNEIYKTSFRVPSDDALDYWVKRFNRLEINHSGIQEHFGVQTLSFSDFDDQQYQLVSDETNKGAKAGIAWKGGPIPLEYAIVGLGPIVVRVAQYDFFKEILDKVFQYKEVMKEGSEYLFEIGQGGNGAQLIVEHNTDLPMARQGYGTVHHAALCVDEQSDIYEWDNHIKSFGLQTSGFVDRFFFQSLYTRVAPQILFELATKGPGFMGDEPYETLGEKLSLPPFLESERDKIESMVRPINTTRSTKTIEKEYE
ncbi:ring-cleaving dioxygenase [Oceanobacillus kimchii]|uniref:ring-cleaving dioxygenase n=1 Tax=Oceanobacillus kimchii TaxID=746691 RepID=UPI0021A89AFC|nr:ring-cleaving dioxygenase [Oceanobacillus kimchii]MCT1575616.1 ring-cleaving dioxygenase [Oceanobacillus kimchii]MCT2137247.1 ring-cleaving dioxygenase [Oceanobacillus kimchii]